MVDATHWATIMWRRQVGLGVGKMSLSLHCETDWSRIRAIARNFLQSKSVLLTSTWVPSPSPSPSTWLSSPSTSPSTRFLCFSTVQVQVQALTSLVKICKQRLQAASASALGHFISQNPSWSFPLDRTGELPSFELSTGYTLPSRSNLHFKFLPFGHSGAQPWAPECPNIKNLKSRFDLDGIERF